MAHKNPKYDAAAQMYADGMNAAEVAKHFGVTQSVMRGILKCRNVEWRGRTGNKNGATHGLTYSPAWHSWVAMKSRCSDPSATQYQWYGARGITVCERWMSFEAFLSDMGERPEGSTLDRYPNGDGNYEPGNCRWATHDQQARNRSNTKLSESDIPLIREMIAGAMSDADIAPHFNVHRITIFDIRTGRTWVSS